MSQRSKLDISGSPEGRDARCQARVPVMSTLTVWDRYPLTHAGFAAMIEELESRDTIGVHPRWEEWASDGSDGQSGSKLSKVQDWKRAGMRD